MVVQVAVLVDMALLLVEPQPQAKEIMVDKAVIHQTEAVAVEVKVLLVQLEIPQVMVVMEAQVV
jgi:hypothetical protein